MNDEAGFNDARDNRNKKQDHAHDSKKRENFIEELERDQKKADKFHQKRETIEAQLADLPSDDEELTADQKHKKAQLKNELEHITKLEGKAQHGVDDHEHKIAKTNIKEAQQQIKHGKHKNMDEFGNKTDHHMD